MKSLRILAALAAAPFILAPGVALRAAEPGAAKAPAAASMEAVGVVAPKVLPAVATKNRQQGRTVELDAFTQALENRLTDALTRTRKFKVVTRGDLDEVLKEQNLAASGNLDANDPQTAQAFKLAGVKSILLVTVDDFQDRLDEFRSESMGQTIVRRTIRAGAAARLIDTTTGRISESVSIPVVTQDDIRALLAKLSSSADRSDAIAPELARLVSDRIARRLVDARFPAKVLAKSPDGVVTFNRGDGSGVQAGQEWGVYAVGEALVDPDTGESLGAEEVLIGRAIVTEVEPKFSKAKLIKDQGVERGAVMRPATGVPVPEGAPPVPAPVSAPAAVPAPSGVTQSIVSPSASVTLTMDKDRTLRLAGREITPADAPGAFSRLALANPNASVVVVADPSVPADSVARVVEALKSAGIKSVGVANP